MSEPPRQKPLPARPAFPAASDAPQGAGLPPVAAPPPDTPGIAGSPVATGPDVSEVRITGRGGVWRVTVLGRAGRASARSAPMLRLGFSPFDAENEPMGPPLEGTVAGRTLNELTEDVLQSALVRAVAPTTDARPRPFFEDADHGGRS